MEVNQKDLANIFNVTTRSIRDWDKNGLPSIVVNKVKMYDTKAVIDWYLKRKLDEAEDTLSNDDEDVKQALRMQAMAKADIAQADAEIKMIELAKKRNDVVLRVAIEDLISDLVAEIKQALDSIPARYASTIGTAKDDIARKQMLNKAIDEVKIMMVNIDILNIEEQEDISNEPTPEDQE